MNVFLIYALNSLVAAVVVVVGETVRSISTNENTCLQLFVHAYAKMQDIDDRCILINSYIRMIVVDNDI